MNIDQAMSFRTWASYMALKAFVEGLAEKREHGKGQHDLCWQKSFAHKHTHRCTPRRSKVELTILLWSGVIRHEKNQGRPKPTDVSNFLQYVRRFGHGLLKCISTCKNSPLNILEKKRSRRLYFSFTFFILRYKSTSNSRHFQTLFSTPFQKLTTFNFGPS